MAKRPEIFEQDHIDEDLEEITAGDPRTASLVREIKDTVQATTGEAPAN